MLDVVDKTHPNGCIDQVNQAWTYDDKAQNLFYYSGGTSALISPNKYSNNWEITFQLSGKFLNYYSDKPEDVKGAAFIICGIFKDSSGLYRDISVVRLANGWQNYYKITNGYQLAKYDNDTYEHANDGRYYHRYINEKFEYVKGEFSYDVQFLIMIDCIENANIGIWDWYRTAEDSKNGISSILNLDNALAKLTLPKRIWTNNKCFVKVKKSGSTIEAWTSDISDSVTDVNPDYHISYTIPSSKPSNLNDSQWETINRCILGESQIGFGTYTRPAICLNDIKSQNLSLK